MLLYKKSASNLSPALSYCGHNQRLGTYTKRAIKDEK
ncbi:uncharacterized protein G2W53_012686 [Senna tora]|uniref:Uncharacterized protein n=1 Tax=Senna tora TaxID=362788 RepID=A0A834TX62_9FABA|nr:uncharacterized protein G2W53_012686 [Senna tora]